jgi:hypothetical protein
MAAGGPGTPSPPLGAPARQPSARWVPARRKGGGGGRAEALKTIGGLVAVDLGLVALAGIAVAGVVWVKGEALSVVSIAAGRSGDGDDHRRVLLG